MNETLNIDLDKLVEEFSNISNNQAYDFAFVRRMLRPDPANPGEFLGNTQRREFIPLLRDLIERLPEHAQIFDIGAGSGETLSLISGDLRNAIVNLVEPNPVLLDRCHERLKNSPNLSPGISFCGILEDFYPNSGMAPPTLSAGQDLILNIHVIYHLTDFRAAQISPKEDIFKAAEFMFSCLNQGGFIFIVFADQLVSTSGQVSRYYFEQIGQKATAERLLHIAQCRRQLLYDGEIVDLLSQTFPHKKAVFKSVFTDSYWYGDNAADILAMCITAEMGEIDDKPFDPGKLKIAATFLEEQGDKIGLTIEQKDVPQKGMVRSNQPQIVSIISLEN